jgi:type I restriction enzyme S subunit
MIINNSKYNQDWQTKSLNELGTFRRGKSKHRPRNDKALFENGKFPLIQTGEIKEANLFITSHINTYNDFGLKQSKLWPKNTLCITIAANIAETAILDYPMCFPDSVVGFNAFENESSELFMHYVFTYIKRAIQNAASGSIQDNINIDFLTNLNFKIPKKESQDKIAKVLSDLDAKIEINNRINTELEAMAKTLYDYWFVQFDFPDTNGKPYKSAGGKMVWNEELKREIPEGWEVTELKNIAKNLMGQSPKGESYNKEGIGMPLLNGPADYENGSLLGRTYTTEPTRICQKDDMVLCIRATIGKLTYAEKEFCLGRGVAAVRPNEKRYSEYIFYCLIQEIERFKIQATGSIIVGITKDDLTDSKCIIPQNDLLDNFHKISNPIFINQRKRKEENQELTSLRDWLLPMLMNGQVTVGDVKEELGMVAEDSASYGK